ncbi:zinc finger protein 197-like [Acyrthosiphon pisum]|uniref:C2H2-type domain-containing protein n=1 Tax=Acyrthosiphon pisum TaxID=7029 RepID=A0A8R2H8V4_ACYPI|nr:zinc finger protein 197-like [Acyrthosiphon pisum]|eukprot:XP_016663862.1 PREDICTED: zinc finger protein 197-like [Acyrthosiphon pisum]
MFKCDHCTSELSTKRNLTTHRKKHLKLLKCDQCTSEFMAKRNLTTHRKRTRVFVSHVQNAPLHSVTSQTSKKHLKNFHGIVQAPIQQRNIRITPNTIILGYARAWKYSDHAAYNRSRYSGWPVTKYHGKRFSSGTNPK